METYSFWYRVILKKVSFGNFRVILVSKGEKTFTMKSRDKVFMIFGHSQNHQNWTFRRQELFLCKNKHHMVVVVVPNFQFSAKS